MRIDLRDLEASLCPSCHGYGHVPDDFDEPDRYYRCDDCGGTGVFRAQPLVPAGCTGTAVSPFVIEHPGGLDGRRACPHHGRRATLTYVQLSEVA